VHELSWELSVRQHEFDKTRSISKNRMERVIEESWSIEIPGLSGERALEIAELLRPDSPFGVLVTDPRMFMVRGYDRATVTFVAKCLEAGLSNGGLDPEDRLGAMSLLEDCVDWLSKAR
jgi:hypothetical protein